MMDDLSTAATLPRGRTAQTGRAKTDDILPRQFAPLIHDAWYVVSSRNAVDHTLQGITVLDTPLVYYRREDGTVAVFDDRCPHRMYPLSKSHLESDSIRCGYHGFTFDGGGQCTFVPGSPHKPNFGLRRYASAERGPWLWVWMGDEKDADPAKIPFVEQGEDVRSSFDGYVLNPCNYMLVIENLLDLTHLHYLHGPMLADKAYSDEAPQQLTFEGGVGTAKVVERMELGLLGLWCGDDPARMTRREETNRAFLPALVEYNAEISPLDRLDEFLHMRRNRFVHALTPKSLYETHQFFWFTVGVPLQVPVEEARAVLVNGFFREDVEAVGYQMEAIMNSTRTDFVERRMLGDQAAMKAYNLLRRSAEGGQA